MSVFPFKISKRRYRFRCVLSEDEVTVDVDTVDGIVMFDGKSLVTERRFTFYALKEKRSII